MSITNKLVSLIFACISFTTNAQVTIVSKNNFNFVRGVYSKKSIDTTNLKLADRVLEPQLVAPSNSETPAFLFPPKQGIVLFNTKNLNDTKSIAGKLIKPSIVQIDTIFHNQAYRAETESDYSFDICYALTVNGEKYYTDFRPHDFIPFKSKLKDHNQTLFLAAQLTGYDMYADKGYPNYFRFVVFENAVNSMHLFFASDLLPFDYSNEFWETESSLKSEYDLAKKELHIEIDGNPTYKAIWMGKELIQN